MDRCQQRLGRARLRLAQKCLHFRPHRFDRVQVGTVRRPKADVRPDRSDQRLRLGVVMRRKVVQDHHVTGAQRRAKNLPDVFAEYRRVRRAFHYHRGGLAVGPYRAEHGGRVPASMRGGVSAPRAAFRAATEPRHIGFGAGLIEEYQAFDGKSRLVGFPRLACGFDVGPILFRRPQRFF